MLVRRMTRKLLMCSSELVEDPWKSIHVTLRLRQHDLVYQITKNPASQPPAGPVDDA